MKTMLFVLLLSGLNFFSVEKDKERSPEYCDGVADMGLAYAAAVREKFHVNNNL